MTNHEIKRKAGSLPPLFWSAVINLFGEDRAHHKAVFFEENGHRNDILMSIVIHEIDDSGFGGAVFDVIHHDSYFLSFGVLPLSTVLLYHGSFHLSTLF
jgi:hypothetical protein